MRDLSNYLRDTMEKTPSKTDWILLSEILSGRLFAACCGFNTETIKFVTICTNLKKHNKQDFCDNIRTDGCFIWVDIGEYFCIFSFFPTTLKCRGIVNRLRKFND